MLICPGCQATVDWTADLDRCEVCSSIHLVRRLGEVECRDCGWVGQPSEGASLSGASVFDGSSEATGSNLAEEVERALSRVLGKSAQRPPFAMS